MEAGIKILELFLKRSVTNLLCCLNVWTGMTEPHLASLAKNLLLTKRAEQAKTVNGGGK
ncbi:MAG: hypothetical protein RLZZ265_1966, partial [Verrucomicrobiota bacterium]|jgi:hypothetical protein